MSLLDAIRGRLGQRTASDYDNLLSGARKAFLNECADLGDKRLNGYDLFTNYYDGEQRTQVLDRARLYLEASGFRFCENFCETVVDVHADRLQVEGFEVEGNEAATDWLNDQWWARNRMDETQGVVHTETLKLGDGCIIEDFDNDLELPRMRWNSPSRVKFCYEDDGDQIAHVVKVWHTSEVSPVNPTGAAVRRMNLYFDNRIEKWFSVDDAVTADWAPWVDEQDVELDPGTQEMVFSVADPTKPSFQWPIWWTDNQQEDGEPLGVPAVHFRHKPKGRRYGRSLLRGVVPQQDQLNKQILDLFYVMDAQGWKQRWAAGIDDASGLTVAIGEWVTSSNVEAKFGEFAAEDPVPLQTVIEGTLTRISARTRTPLHDMINGDPPSGEALKTAESGIVKASEDRQTTMGNGWEDGARIGWRIGSVFGDAPEFDPKAVIKCLWKSPETRNEAIEATVDETELRMGVVSKQTVAEKRGYDWDQEKERILDERKAFGSPLDPFAATLPPGDEPPPKAKPKPPPGPS